MPSKRVGGAVEIVLGVSMTPTRVSIALVEGEKADGVIIDHDVFDISAAGGSATSSAPEHVVAAVLGTQEGAIAAGHHLVSTGVAWTDHDEAAMLREALVAHDIEDVLLVSELHAAAALAKTIGLAVGYDKTALMFVEPETATLAVVETVDGSVAKVLSRGLQDGDATAVVAEMVTSLEVDESVAPGMFVVGSGVDITAVKAHLQEIVPVPVIAPEEPQLALARGAALASASAPRYDTSTIGLAYSHDPDGTTVYPFFSADDTTTPLGHADATQDTVPAIASDPDDVPLHNKPFLLVGSTLAAIFIAGMMALTLALVVNVRPTADRDSNDLATNPSAAALPPALQGAPPTAPQLLPKAVPSPAPPAPLPARVAMAQLKELPAPPPQVLVHDAAPAPAVLPPAPVAPPPPPVALPPGIPPVIVQWLPPIVPPQFFNPGVKGPQFGGHGGHGGHGGGKHGRGGD
jgi:hypothetical protein